VVQQVIARVQRQLRAHRVSLGSCNLQLCDVASTVPVGSLQEAAKRATLSQGELLLNQDLKEFEPDLYATLRNIQKAENVDSMNLTFSTSYDNFGMEQVVEFKAGGASIGVTNQNKQEFVDLYVDWYLNRSVESQFTPFYKGFYKVISHESIRVTFDLRSFSTVQRSKN
jgi:hypothetical protein